LLVTRIEGQRKAKEKMLLPIKMKGTLKKIAYHGGG
jgi:hypothetical protein